MHGALWSQVYTYCLFLFNDILMDKTQSMWEYLILLNLHSMRIFWVQHGGHGQNKALDANIASVCIPHERICYQFIVCQL
jgi:hypothetical protein